MISRLKSLLLGTSADTPDKGHDSVQLAAAAVLVEAAMMDGRIKDAEKAHIHSLMRERFKLTDEEADELVASAIEAMQESSQLLPFTRTIKDNFDYEQRIEIIEMLWEVAYADGQLHDYESNLARRVSGLIYVTDQDSGAARKRAMARLGLNDGTLG
ncbi:TerB family tellurite resistance protein [Telmatospirillum sp. J64-1]|uniref:tellurite resistance TerB family protein n=1 Tax=Telmatospirillum sp. J64-1 TaxID=2502183 RepID=UPI00163D6094|nr:TerB family tellurite resistance protein [Telmatospirillum sp. J64-1]